MFLLDGEVIKADDIPVYSDTAQMALKLQTSAERKATKEKKVKKSKDDTDKVYFTQWVNNTVYAKLAMNKRMLFTYELSNLCLNAFNFNQQ